MLTGRVEGRRVEGGYEVYQRDRVLKFIPEKDFDEKLRRTAKQNGWNGWEDL